MSAYTVNHVIRIFTFGFFDRITFTGIKFICVLRIMSNIPLVTNIAVGTLAIVMLLTRIVSGNARHSIAFSNMIASFSLILSGPLGLSTPRKLPT